MLVSLEEIKGYLRIDSDAEDSLLTSLADTAEQLSLAILRAKSWKEVKKQEAVRTAVLYAVAYLFAIASWYCDREMRPTRRAISSSRAARGIVPVGRRSCRLRRKSRTGMPSRSRKLSIASLCAIGKTFEIRTSSNGETRLWQSKRRPTAWTAESGGS